VLFVTIGLGSAALAAGYTLLGLWSFAGVAVGLTAFWYAGIYYEWGWANGIAFLAFWGLAVAGAVYGVGVIWLASGLVAALAAWELSNFTKRMQPFPHNDMLDLIARRHLWRLLTVSLVSTVLVIISLGFQLSLPFGWAFVRALVALLGLSQAVGYLRGAGE
jgi:hypothetical protein